jgi:hypothetical protein
MIFVTMYWASKHDHFIHSCEENGAAQQLLAHVTGKCRLTSALATLIQESGNVSI